MKKLLLTCGAMALLTGAAGHAQAQEVNDRGPWLRADIDLVKLVGTLEIITIPTTVSINQTVTTVADDAAEASAIANQLNTDQKDCGNCAEKLDVIENSADVNTGLVSVNQSAGNNNNQGTLVSAAVDEDSGTATQTHSTTTTTTGGGTGTPATGAGFAHAQAEATQINGEVSGGGRNDVEAVDLTFRQALMTNSGNQNVGLLYINQATGNNANQLNELALAFAERGSGTAIAEADLGQFNSGNLVGEGASDVASTPIGINKNATITGSLNNNIGVFGVNQSVGNNSNQANIVSVAAIGTNLPGF